MKINSIKSALLLSTVVLASAAPIVNANENVATPAPTDPKVTVVNPLENNAAPAENTPVADDKKVDDAKPAETAPEAVDKGAVKPADQVPTVTDGTAVKPTTEVKAPAVTPEKELEDAKAKLAEATAKKEAAVATRDAADVKLRLLVGLKNDTVKTVDDLEAKKNTVLSTILNAQIAYDAADKKIEELKANNGSAEEIKAQEELSAAKKAEFDKANDELKLINEILELSAKPKEEITNAIVATELKFAQANAEATDAELAENKAKDAVKAAEKKVADAKAPEVKPDDTKKPEDTKKPDANVKPNDDKQTPQDNGGALGGTVKRVYKFVDTEGNEIKPQLTTETVKKGDDAALKALHDKIVAEKIEGYVFDSEKLTETKADLDSVNNTNAYTEFFTLTFKKVNAEVKPEEKKDEQAKPEEQKPTQNEGTRTQAKPENKQELAKTGFGVISSAIAGVVAAVSGAGVAIVNRKKK